MNLIIFLMSYMIFMVPTYLIRFAGFSLLVDESSRGVEKGFIGETIIIMLVICFFLMAVIAYYRGHRIGKPWLIALPIIAAVFDIVLVIVPFVPTVLHVLTLVLGAMTPTVPEHAVQGTNQSNEPPPPSRNLPG